MILVHFKSFLNVQYSRKYSISIIINNVIDDFLFLINYWFNAIYLCFGSNFGPQYIVQTKGLIFSLFK